MLLKELIMENNGDAITSRNIFDFYYLFTISQLQPAALQTNYGTHTENLFLNALKAKYISNFKTIISKQIQKYHDRKRIDPDFNVSLMVNASPATLLDLMKKTFRSDMTRRNEVWILACEYLMKLENSSNKKETYLYIDRLNNCIHNTQSSILSKFANGSALVSAYDKVHHARSIKAYESNVSNDLVQIIRQDQDL